MPAGPIGLSALRHPQHRFALPPQVPLPSFLKRTAGFARHCRTRRLLGWTRLGRKARRASARIRGWPARPRSPFERDQRPCRGSPRAVGPPELFAPRPTGSAAATRRSPRTATAELGHTQGLSRISRAGAPGFPPRSWSAGNSPSSSNGAQSLRCASRMRRSATCGGKAKRCCEMRKAASPIARTGTATASSSPLCPTSFTPWVRDMAWATVALIRMGHRAEARAALLAYFNARRPQDARPSERRGLPDFGGPLLGRWRRGALLHAGRQHQHRIRRLGRSALGPGRISSAITTTRHSFWPPPRAAGCSRARAISSSSR